MIEQAPVDGIRNLLTNSAILSHLAASECESGGDFSNERRTLFARCISVGNNLDCVQRGYAPRQFFIPRRPPCHCVAGRT